MPKFRKKPVVIEAIQFNGSNKIECIEFTNQTAFARSEKDINGAVKFWVISIPTLEGDMIASPNDWIIKGVNGEFYPCKPDIFEKTYEPINELKEDK